MLNKINYVPHDKNNLTMVCLECGDERIEAFQCDCGKKFCRSCCPDAFELGDFGDSLYVTCPSCKAEMLFI